MQYFCCDKRRRQAVQAHGTVNGIDFLEVLDHDAPATIPQIERQQTLLVHFLKPIPALSAKHLAIEGGVRRTPVNVVWAAPASVVPSPPAAVQEATWFSTLAEADHVLVVRTSSTGDYSNYQLVLREAVNGPPMLHNFDPQLSSVEFSFKVECPSDFDCHSTRACPPKPIDLPDIDYLAKDYGSFRRLMLDRMALLAPAWRERHAADQGIALIELLAYVGDQLSYQQDAIATEAYIGTARRRLSVRRHARLVDYSMHDGCNARAWIHIEVDGDVVLEQGTQLLTKIPEMPIRLKPNSADYDIAMREHPIVFETMHPTKLFQTHNEFRFYTWGDRQCCLPKGATRATLQSKKGTALEKGMVLIFVEQLGPHTGVEKDADPMKRHTVRLTDVRPKQDPVGGRFEDTPADHAVDVIEVSWDEGDALPFAFCISSVTDDKQYKDNVTVALGNIVLADHGRTTMPDLVEELGPVPPAIPRLTPQSVDRCKPNPPEWRPPRFRPKLQERPVTQIGHVPVEVYQDGKKQVVFMAFDPSKSAAASFRWDMKHVLPSIRLRDRTGKGWEPKRDLFSSDGFDTTFVVEVEEDATAVLRFGDGEHGLAPNAGLTFRPTYRVGNGAVGNIAAESLVHIVTTKSEITRVINPMAAQGGMEMESVEDVRQRAPVAFRTQERAVTEDDYARVAGQHLGVQRAVAAFRWTGSWYTVFLTIDRIDGKKVDELFKEEILSHLERYRLAGRDVEVDDPLMVPLEIDLHVCAKPDYFRSDINETLLQVFSSQYLPDGSQGFFHPDRFTFGQPVYLSQIYDTAQAVAGVASVKVTTFQRQNVPTREYLDAGRIMVGYREIVRLDNDRNFPEHGVLRIAVGGGK
jgi:hypothetical protein